MNILEDLFTTDYGLVALAFTLVSLALAIAMRVFIVKKMRESEMTHTLPANTNTKE